PVDWTGRLFPGPSRRSGRWIPGPARRWGPWAPKPTRVQAELGPGRRRAAIRVLLILDRRVSVSGHNGGMHNGADSNEDLREEHRIKMRGRLLRRSASFNVAHAVDSLEPGTGAQSIQRALTLLNLVGLIAGERREGASLSELAS